MAKVFRAFICNNCNNGKAHTEVGFKPIPLGWYELRINAKENKLFCSIGCLQDYITTNLVRLR